MRQSHVRSKGLEVLARAAVAVLYVITTSVGPAYLRICLAGRIARTLYDQELFFAALHVAQQLEEEVLRWIVPALAGLHLDPQDRLNHDPMIAWAVVPMACHCGR
jgi:hypothetical protein